jgi:hypothetical protein
MGGKINSDYVGDLKCWPFSQPRTVRGVWVIQFETSVFYLDATNFEEIKNLEPNIWLQNEAKRRPPLLDPTPAANSRAYLVEAEGRLSLCDAWFGHQGRYPRELIVIGFHSIKPLPTS